MKKVITIVLMAIAIAMPLSISASVGYGATNCIPSTDPRWMQIKTSTTPYIGPTLICDKEFDQYNRLADLEAAVDSLKSQLAGAGQNSTLCSCNTSEIQSLNTRVSVLEKTVNLIVGQVSQALVEIIKYLSK